MKVVHLDFHTINNGGNLAQEDIPKLAVFTDLERLNLGRQPLNDAGLASLAPLKKLKWLCVALTNITPASAKTIREFPQLEHLHGPDSDEWLEALAGATNLRSMLFYRTGLSELAVSWFKQYPNLTELTFEEAGPWTNTSLAHLNDCQNLKKLILNHISIDDNNIETLSGLTQLSELTLQYAKFTEAGIKKLATALPQCKITWDGGVMEPKVAAPAKITTLSDPAFQNWLQSAAKLPAQQQLDAVVKKLQELNPGFDGKYSHVIESDAVVHFDVLTDNVTNLAPVRVLRKLRSLVCCGSQPGNGKLVDLSPLQGLPLQHLNCQNNPLTDLAPLNKLPLEKLECSCCPISDLTLLKGLKLKRLIARGCQVASLAPLTGMPLVELEIPSCPLSDLSPLRGMRLSTLYAAICGQTICPSLKACHWSICIVRTRKFLI